MVRFIYTITLTAIAILNTVLGCKADAVTYPVLKPNNYSWSFSSIAGGYNKHQLQRGLQVYRQVCSACHSLRYVAFNSLQKLGYSPEQINYLAKQYGTDSNGHFPTPFADDASAREANNGALPPDLSNIAKQRGNLKYNSTSGADYIASLLTGYSNDTTEQPQSYGFKNPYFANAEYINMPPPLSDNLVDYHDGTPQTTEQYAKDVSAFLYWCSNPNLTEEHKTGFAVLCFLLTSIFIVFLLKKHYEQQLKKVNKSD